MDGEHGKPTDEVVERSWFRSFADVEREHGLEPVAIEGTIPRELSGTMYRNGPGLFSLFGRRYQHWFDGDGVVSAVRFREGRAESAMRLVESRGLLEERQRGKPYFGAFGTRSPGMWSPFRALRFIREGGKNPANTSILSWGDRVFALCEIGRPTEIDPETLRTIGEQDLGCIVRPFSAHPHHVAETGYTYNFGVRFGRPNAIDLYALRPDGTAGKLTEIPLAGPTLIHDFAATAKHLVIFLGPVDIALYRILFGRAALADAMTWCPERGSEVIVVPLDAPASPIRFQTDAFWAWHCGNAFERDGEIVVDVVKHADFVGTSTWLSGVARGAPIGEASGALHRATIDPRKKTLRWEALRDRTGEFPRVAPRVEGRAHRHTFFTEHSSPAIARNAPPDTLVRVDEGRSAIDEHRFAPHEWPSEGVFVPRPGARDEADGWLVSLVYDARAHRSAWTIFDAQHLGDGPIGRAVLDHHVPLGFHGTFRPDRA